MDETDLVPVGFWNSAQEALFKKDAEIVLELLRNNELILVGKPHRVGGTELFIPELTAQASQSGYGVCKDDYSYFAEPQFVVRDIRNKFQKMENNSYLYVMDAALYLLNDPEERRNTILHEIFTVLKEKGMHAVFLLAGSTIDVREGTGRKWQEDAIASGIHCAVHSLQTIHIPKELVSELLEKWKASPELIEFFLADENKALRTAMVLKMFIDSFTDSTKPERVFHNLLEFQEFLLRENRLENWPTNNRVGGSKKDWFTMLYNLRIEDHLPGGREELESIEEFTSDYD